MKLTVDLYQFRKAFESIRPENFSYEAVEALFDQYEEYERDSGEEMELDVIAICCDWTEYTKNEVIDQYGSDADVDGNESLDEQYDVVIEFLNDQTQVIELSDSVIVSNF